MTLATACRVCGGETEPLIDFGPQPPSDPLWTSPQPSDPGRRHPLRLDCCRNCGLVQIIDPAPPEMIYPEASLEMTSWKNLPQTVWQVELLRKHVPLNAVIVETGSNDGHFLSALRDGGFSRLAGIEPSRVSGPLAREKGFDIREGFATPALAEELARDYDRFDLAVAKHMLGHIPDLEQYFMCLDILLKPDGKLFLEIPDFDAVLDAADCSLVYEELVSYFTTATLRFTLERFGYRVLEEKRLANNGGLVEVLAERGFNRSDACPPAIPAGLGTFAKRAREYAARLDAKLAALREAGWSVLLFGAGPRSASLLNCFGLARRIDAIVDDNPVKQGKFYPGCALPIVSSGEAAKTAGKKIFLLAVSNENEAKVTEAIHSLFGDAAPCVSVFGPKDRDRELAKLESF